MMMLMMMIELFFHDEDVKIAQGVERLYENMTFHTYTEEVTMMMMMMMIMASLTLLLQNE